MSLKNKIYGYFRGITYVYLWYLSIISGYIVLFCPLFILLFVSNHLYRKITDKIYEFWELYPTVLLQKLYGIEFVLTGDRIRNEKSVIIVNHRTRTDWNFLWPVINQSLENGHNMKFILKDDIKLIPGIGWVMQLSCFLFIKRNFQIDMIKIKKYINYLNTLNFDCQILIFPEGTDLTPNTIDKSHNFAVKNNLQKYEYVLHPRTSGFSYLAKKMMKSNLLNSVYDLTLSYKGAIPQNEKCVLRGDFPNEVHCKITRYPRSVIGKTEEELTNFLNERWKEKESQLKSFHTNKNYKLDQNNKINLEISNFSLYLAFVFWTVLPLIATYLLFNFYYFTNYVIFHTICLFAITYIFNSFLEFEIELFNFLSS